MILEINPHSEEPIYLQLRKQIIIGIAKGELNPNEQLPTVRQIADEIGINSMTVSKGYQQLKEEGYILTDRRKGTVIAPLPVESNKSNEENLTLLLAELYLAEPDEKKLTDKIQAILSSFRKDEN
ncbi:GntR family transcriptional regulator [Enterococcus dongliensis]|uniref:GntR family transcriptional regulator n=1 Tax=Enterococcus dongliensis TaxID=2559925 RepID=A0AAP5NL12_9ENTE|nr:GntR family transcriptional regulator [Enterococcus dongliensis]MDT2596315.1 GntR family transcriptional regulator [Enterococcus dongliensis]MDT2604356.1 GntR family transcriptional regulator [Enterococcus dongliensis]MDT2635224.1 GntR family transcriptional regulator [Enterococcus dongliensis]MDT2637494.1 GntR family transcriptional regulator [Enterococcus dongliensis]MDT2643239.1 GntR family transcriptional regulator [Enterococcus dongliensis]